MFVVTKLSPDVLAEPLPVAINISISTYTFPSNAKIVSVVPNEKKTDDKYVISNFRSVIILNCLSKVYENVIKNESVKSMNVHISSFITPYGKDYSTQHVLLRLLGERRWILMDLAKTSDCIPHDLLLWKVATHGIDDNLILYIHSYLLNCKWI